MDEKKILVDVKENHFKVDCIIHHRITVGGRNIRRPDLHFTIRIMIMMMIMIILFGNSNKTKYTRVV